MYFLIINIIIHQAPERSSDQLFSSMVAHCLPLLPSNSGDVRATIIIDGVGVICHCRHASIFTYFFCKDNCGKTKIFCPGQHACTQGGKGVRGDYSILC